MTTPIAFDNSYARLPDRFFVRQQPVPVAQPSLLALNRPLADELGIEIDWLASEAGLAVLAGNAAAEGSEPLAQAYAGHQFAGWVPQLGDGRAVLLGEVIDRNGQRRDIQLKGAGRTPFSRNGDGRAWLGPVLREYVVSEAMHALGIPTTRALAAVRTGEQVQRETALPGAVLTRVAASHIRVGTFQYFAARQDTEALQVLADHTIARHYPDVTTPQELLVAVMERQAKLVAAWMGVGFIHGVMNTDNMAISGETIDYGPCAFMDAYHPATVYSSIDRAGRYAYGRQADMAVWNLAQFASALLPLMGGEAGIEVATETINRFPQMFRDAWMQVFARKIGLDDPTADDLPLIENFLHGLAEQQADFTNSFRDLAQGDVPAGMEPWGREWQARVTLNDQTRARMNAVNPAVIARNHRVEQMIQAAVNGDMMPFEKLMHALATPYVDVAGDDFYRQPPRPEEVVQRTFCGT